MIQRIPSQALQQNLSPGPVRRLSNSIRTKLASSRVCLQAFDASHGYIASKREAGVSVLVHCSRGLNRSAALVKHITPPPAPHALVPLPTYFAPSAKASLGLTRGVATRVNCRWRTTCGRPEPPAPGWKRLRWLGGAGAARSSTRISSFRFKSASRAARMAQ